MSPPAEAALTLVLIRHGQTEWNRDGLLQGHADVPLDEVGLRQAAKLGRRLAREAYRPGVLWTSDLSRAAHTAAIVAEGLGTAPAEPRPEWRERHVGVFQGRSRAWLKEHDPARYEAWRADPAGYRPDGGESYREHRARIARCLDQLRERFGPGGRVTIVTHGGCAYAALSICAGGDFPENPKLRIVNTSLSELCWTPAEGWKAVRVNDCEHLDPGERGAE